MPGSRVQPEVSADFRTAVRLSVLVSLCFVSSSHESGCSRVVAPLDGTIGVVYNCNSRSAAVQPPEVYGPKVCLQSSGYTASGDVILLGDIQRLKSAFYLKFF